MLQNSVVGAKLIGGGTAKRSVGVDVDVVQSGSTPGHDVKTAIPHTFTSTLRHKFFGHMTISLEIMSQTY